MPIVLAFAKQSLGLQEIASSLTLLAMTARILLQLILIMDTGVFALVLLFLLAAATGGAIVALSALVGRRLAPEERGLPYECGLDPVGTSRQRFSVKFFLIAVLFIVFDVEIVFMYPWALVFRDMARALGPLFVILEISVFVVFLSLALVYVWGRGALEWEK